MNYINLTNGIEAIPDLPAGWEAVRVSSTSIEKRDWEGLFGDLDHGMLFRLSQGEECRLYDFGSGRPMSKTVRVGVPLIRNVLGQVWLGANAECGLSAFVRDHLMMATTDSARNVKRKLLYYRRILKTSQIRLYGVSRQTAHDGD